jgi:hypothetical protein
MAKEYKFDPTGAAQVQPEPEEVKGVPRITHWVCREDKCFWTRPGTDGGHLYRKGDTIDIEFSQHETPHKWDYAREYWYPAGASVVDVETDRLIPFQFEPYDPEGAKETKKLWAKILVDPRKINYARNKVPVGGPGEPFNFRFEIMDTKINVEILDAPEPTSPKQLLNPAPEPERFNPADMSTGRAIR